MIVPADKSDRAPADYQDDSPRLEALPAELLRPLYVASRLLAEGTGAAPVAEAMVSCALGLGACASAVFVPGAAPHELYRAARAGDADEIPPTLSLPAQWERLMLADQGVGPREGLRDLLAAMLPAPGAATQLLATPLLGRGRAHGLLIALWLAPPSASQRQAIGALARDGGAALARDGAAALADPNGILAAINAITDIGLIYNNLLEQMIGAMLAQILRIAPLGSGAILLYDEQHNQLELVASVRAGQAPGPAEAAPLWQPDRREQSVAAARVAANAGAVAIATADAGTALGQSLRELGAGQLLSIPMLAGGWLTGMLQVATQGGASIDPEQLATLQILARQAAVAIEHARLFAQIRSGQERTSAVVDATNDAILMLDEHRRVMIVNRRARFFFGMAEGDLEGRGLEQLGATLARIFENAPRFQSWLRQLLRSTGERAVEEFQIVHPEQRLLQCFSAPVMDARDRYLGRILVFRDITREREVERMKSDFVSNVSHELRTPLTSIQGALQLVLGPGGGGRPGMIEGLPKRANDLLTISLNNTERLIRLINDILDIAKIEQGRIQLRRELLQPESLCRSAAADMSAFANNRGVTIELDLPAALPKIFADGDRSAQILINLLSNAIKFSATGQGVLLSARHEGAMVCFAVRDWGRGIAPADQDRLFQKFQQIDSSTTRDVGGTGLGLAISKALVEEQGGRIWLDSAPARGSTFSFTLPVATGADHSGAERVARPVVLLVALADLGPAGAALRDALLSRGWLVHEIASRAAIVEAAQTVRPALLISALPSDLSASQDLIDTLRGSAATQAVGQLLIGRLDAAAAPATLLAPETPVAEMVEQAQAILTARQPHILVVDDDPYVRPVLVRLLQRHGLRVTNVSDGYAALSAIEQLRPDVILLDVKMPGLDGTEVLRRIKQNVATAAIPVIILTANDLGDSLQAQVLNLGANGYLEKPISAERLISTVMGAIAPRGGPHGY